MLFTIAGSPQLLTHGVGNDLNSSCTNSSFCSCYGREEPTLLGNAHVPQVIPAGTTIPVRYDKAQKIIVAPKETVPVTLTVAKTFAHLRKESWFQWWVRSRSNTAKGEVLSLLPKNLFSQSAPGEATSEVITTTETINKELIQTSLEEL